MDVQSDEELIQHWYAILDGQSPGDADEVFQVLWGRFNKQLSGLTRYLLREYHFVGKENLVEDLVSQTCFKLLRSGHRPSARFRPEKKSKFRTWLHRVHTNTWISFQRKYGKENRKSQAFTDVQAQNALAGPGSEDEGWLEPVDELDLPPLSAMMHEEQLARLMEGINRLPKKQGQLVKLAYLGAEEGGGKPMKQKDIAAMLGMSEAWVATHLQKARASLSKWLQEG